MDDLFEKRDTWDLPVVGSVYVPNFWDVFKELAVGDVLRLVPEPDNPHDPQALAVYAGESRIGYVPNKGYSCRVCNRPFEKGVAHCPCGSSRVDSEARGGLAYRLNRAKALEQDPLIYIATLDPASEFSPVKATLMIREKPHVQERT